MEYQRSRKPRSGPARRQWDAEQLRALRQHLGLSQRELGEELGVRQQTVSEWETSIYRPRGASARLLSLIAEQSSFRYQTEEAGAAGPPDASGAARKSDPTDEHRGQR